MVVEGHRPRFDTSTLLNCQMRLQMTHGGLWGGEEITCTQQPYVELGTCLFVFQKLFSRHRPLDANIEANDGLKNGLIDHVLCI